MRKEMNSFELMDEMFGMMSPVRSPYITMKTDIVENDKEFIFYMDVPGVEKKDIKVVVEEGVLIISAERKALAVEDGKVILRERRAHTSKRSFRLPANVNSGDIKAKYDNGILILTVKKPEDIQPHNIDID